MSFEAEYDIIFAGGGTSACVTAGRLAAADPSLRILLIEAGKHTKDLPAHIQPARYFGHLHPTSSTVSFHVGAPSKSLDGRAPIVTTGHAVGGGSSVNFMMYTRAAASDYDDWETVYENPGWGSKDLIPLLKKTETFQAHPDRETHGYSGPLKVSQGTTLNVGQQFLDVAAKYDKEREFTDDVNGMYSCNAYGKWPKWIGSETGKRSDAAHHFIYNQASNKNMQVIDGKRVTRILFDGKRAVGVEYVDESTALLAKSTNTYTAHASKLVIISAGTFGSPAILERSGIGARRVLEQHDIKQIVDLPGVGENYLDHNLVFNPILAGDEADSLDGIFSGDNDAIEKYNVQWVTEKGGLMAHNGIDAGIKLRPNAKDLEELGPEFTGRWQQYFANAPDKPVVWLGALAAYLGDHSTAPRRKYFTLGYYTEYPVSVGSLHISSQDPHAPYQFHAGFLDDPADVAVLRWAYKRGREIARRLPLYRGEFVREAPDFAEASAASCQEELGPVDIDAPDIKYSPEDDEAIDTFHRKTVATTWHSLGTCAMKPRDKGGVVNPRLNVYGVEGLKVADCSIAPANVGANTYSTALVIGERAAIIIAEELGIKGV